MIKKLTITNFQNHLKSELNFSEGLNVIYGDNDQGKSAILRALNWVINNRPSGFNFRNNKNKGTTSVIIDIDDNKIQRFRDDSNNGYKIDGKIFKALRSDVPGEVTNILNLSSVAYQNQFTPHFLFTDSPGEVAKKINRIVGLEEIDIILSKVKSAKETNNREIKYLSDKVSKKEKEIELYENLPEIYERSLLLQKREKILEKKKEELDKLSFLLDEYEERKELILMYRDIDSINSKLTKLEAYQEKTNQLHQERSQFFRKITLLLELEQNKNKYTLIPDLIKQTEMIEQKENELEELGEEKIELLSSISKLERLNNDIKYIIVPIKKKTEQIDKLKKELKICPLCDKPF